MARVKVRHFIEKPGSSGPRYFWQPSAALRALGWRNERLPAALPEAIARAEELNRQLDAWRTGTDTALLATTPPRGPQPGTVADLIRRYKASRFYTEKATKTQYEYGQNLKTIEAWAGDLQVAAITPPRVQKLYDELRVGTHAKANAVVTMLRILFSHGVREGMVTTNPAANPGLEGLEFSGKLWTRDAVAFFVEVADRMGWPSIGTAVLIDHWLGQREGDILAMPRAAYHKGRFWIHQKKTGAKVAVPHSPWVAERVEAMLSARKVAGTKNLLICESTGQPWKQRHFGEIFAAVRAKVAEEWPAFEAMDGSWTPTSELWFMHLRHTAVTELAIAGCSILEIAAITGHTIKSVTQILERYFVRSSDVADAAMKKRLESGDFTAFGTAKNDSEEHAKND